jgi:hypothetical protein
MKEGLSAADLLVVSPLVKGGSSLVIFQPLQYCTVYHNLKNRNNYGTALLRISDILVPDLDP